MGTRILCPVFAGHQLLANSSMEEDAFHFVLKMRSDDGESHTVRKRTLRASCAAVIPECRRSGRARWIDNCVH